MLDKLPSPTAVPHLEKRARRAPFCAGLGVALLGGGVLSCALLGDGATQEAALPWLGGGITGLLAGAILIYASYIEMCAVCRVTLASTHATLPLELHARVRSAVQCAELGDLDSLALLEHAPQAPPRALRMASLELRFCPGCRQIGRLSSAERRHDHLRH